MTIWTPKLDPNLPRYRALADAIARDLAEGRLRVGDRLPPHRDLADALGVTVGTVSRGYAEAERRGLTSGEVGRGTFIRKPSPYDPWPAQAPSSEVVDLSLSLPVSVPEEGPALAQTLRDIATESHLGELLAYHPESALVRQKAAAAKWLASLGLAPSAEEVLVTAGSQHGLNVALGAVFRPGDVLLTEALTYPSIKSQARAFGLRLRGVAMDEEGICPEALARACTSEPRPAGLYLVPTLQNPTTGTLSAERRQALAEICRSHGLWIIEDDVHAFLLPDPPAPLATFAPENTVYLASVAKCLVPGLRTGFLVAPEALRHHLLTAIHTSMWMPPPLMVEVTTRWFSEGTADRFIAAKRRETRSRQEIAARILAGQTFRADPNGYQIWLTLPEPWHTDEFVAQARARKVIVVGAGAFAPDRQPLPQAVRLSLGIPTRGDMARGLTALSELLAGHTTPAF